MRKISVSSFFALAFALAFIYSFNIDAHAAVPDKGAAPRGWNGHENTVLDKSLYSDASLYDNRSYTGYNMRVGLDFGSDAVTWASFENSSGGGFIIGYYDDNNVFHAERQTKAHYLFVNIQSNKDELEAGSDEELLYNFQVVNGIDSAVVLTMDSTVTELALISADGAAIKYGENSYMGGFECLLAKGSMSVINYVGLEDYVKGVIPYEMSSYWPYEALCAQAVCARTYGVYNINAYADYGFDVTDDTRSQVYRGVADADSNTDSAVDSTAGELVRYKGEICEIYYFSSDGGATEDVSNVFSGSRPYLAGKTDPFEKSVDFTLSSWEFEKSGEAISRILEDAGFNIDTVTSILPVLSRTGNVVALHFYDENDNSVVIEGRRCYTILGLHNCRFNIVQDGDMFRFTGSGWGHNCGMSQWGAYAMADVYGYDYEDIIRFYFTGAYVA